jgi:glycosyltransferase involved in cell wall biosynthesis
VVSCTNKDHLASWPACRRARIPSVWWVNDILSRDFFPWIVRRTFVRQARRGATRLVAVSEYVRNVLLRHALFPGRVVTIHNGIPLERYQRRPRGFLRALLNLGPDEFLLGVAGRFTPWKGQDFFVRLAEAWVKRSRPGHFVLIGHSFNEDQPFERQLRDEVRGRGLDERVHFVPFQSDIAAALSDLDVFVHTSTKPEPFGRVLIEAMAVEVPVIAANHGGVPEIVTHGVNGLLAAPGTLRAYLSAMEALHRDERLRTRFAAAGRARVVDQFPIARVRAGFDQLFTAIGAGWSGEEQ